MYLKFMQLVPALKLLNFALVFIAAESMYVPDIPAFKCKKKFRKLLQIRFLKRHLQKAKYGTELNRK